MNKLLFFIRIILFHIILLLFYFVIRITDLVGWGEFFFIVIAFLYEFLLIKDMIKKQNINHNIKYNVLSIMCFIMIIFILSRCLIDPHFLFHNSSFLKELNDYQTLLYGYYNSGNVVQFSDIIGYYLMNNTYYFHGMFLLLFIYRRINLNISKNVY